MRSGKLFKDKYGIYTLVEPPGRKGIFPAALGIFSPGKDVHLVAGKINQAWVDELQKSSRMPPGERRTDDTEMGIMKETVGRFYKQKSPAMRGSKSK